MVRTQTKIEVFFLIIILVKSYEAGKRQTTRLNQAMQLTREQYEMLMMGLNPVRPKIRDVNPQKVF